MMLETVWHLIFGGRPLSGVEDASRKSTTNANRLAAAANLKAQRRLRHSLERATKNPTLVNGLTNSLNGRPYKNGKVDT